MEDQEDDDFDEEDLSPDEMQQRGREVWEQVQVFILGVSVLAVAGAGGFVFLLFRNFGVAGGVSGMCLVIVAFFGFMYWLAENH